MFWKLPPSVRSLCVLTLRRSYSSSPSPPRPSRDIEPLRILFCGSDEFSIASLRALCEAKEKEPGLIEDIEVVHRTDKRTGRGLKQVSEVPIKSIARTLSLRTHPLDTFTNWTPPTPPSLIIAVSFGLLIPARLLSQAPHGGLNVHPSLLPDLRGPAPLHHTLLRQRSHTGVTVQTLHPTRFDAGTVLAQTPAPGVVVPGVVQGHALGPTGGLVEELGRLGGEMLVEVLRRRLFVSPREAGWYAASGGPVDYAGKITKEHWRIPHLRSCSAADLLTRSAALGGGLWFEMGDGRRVVIGDVSGLGDGWLEGDWEPGLWVDEAGRRLVIVTVEGGALEVLRPTVAGGKKGGGFEAVAQVLRREGRVIPARATGMEA